MQLYSLMDNPKKLLKLINDCLNQFGKYLPRRRW